MGISFTDQFSQTFRAEHREIRDALLGLVQAFQARDLERARPLLLRTAELTGPHFRYEEDAMYPALVPNFGDEYIDKLLGDHDRAIGASQRLVEITKHNTLTDLEVRDGIRHVWGLLPHLSDCDGLSIMVECLPENQVEAIFTARDHSRHANLDLLTWASTIRPRPAVVPE